MKALSKFLVSILLLAITVSAWAWHEGKPPGSKFSPEEDDSVKASQQVGAEHMGEVGVVQSDDDEPQMPNAEPSDSDAADAVASAAENAEENLKGAEASLKGRSSKSGTFIFTALICAALGFGGIAAVRHWANKTVPVPSGKRKKG